MVKHYAHSANKAGDKHLLKDHLLSVNEMVKDFLKDFKIASEARLAGLIHDFGKYGDLFQDRLKGKEQGTPHFDELNGQKEIALQIGRVDEIDNHTGVFHQ